MDHKQRALKEPNPVDLVLCLADGVPGEWAPGMGNVDSMTLFEMEGGPRLELPDEPVDIKNALRDALLNGQDWRDGFSDDICIGLWLWGRWRPALEPEGMSREDFVDVVIANRRELWLWLVGDRQWLQFVSSLVGRIVRRLPSAIDS
jgi:hypothetical protein